MKILKRGASAPKHRKSQKLNGKNGTKTSKAKKRKKPFFNPDSIVERLESALKRDLGEFENFSSSYQHTRVRWAHPNSSLSIATNAPYRQLQDFKKKYLPLDVDSDKLEAEALQKFLDINQHLERFNQRSFFDGIPAKISQDTCFQHRVLIRARALFRWILRDITEDEWFLACKHSNGSSIGVPFRDTSLERKLSFPISCTERGKNRLRRYFLWDRQSREAVLNWNAMSGKPPYTVVEGSRATTVDKDARKRRFICIEPTGNMFLQQGYMHVMYDRLREFGLDLSFAPEVHKVYAWISSIISRDATIDWTSASDCNSVELIRYLSSPKWFDIIDICRCPVTDIKGKKIPLNMISSMGNAGTFPLETLVFLTLALATKWTLSSPRSTSVLVERFDKFKTEGITVFGDDCIVPANMAPEYIGIMEGLGYIVNNEKSFYSVPDHNGFRESCGGDFLHGSNTRPFCIKAPSRRNKASLVPWLCIAFNELIPRYISYFGSLSYIYDREIFRVLEYVCRRYKVEIPLVPSYFPDDAGLKISFDYNRFRLHYPLVVLSEILEDRNGTKVFPFYSFKYFEREAPLTHPEIRYVDRIKKWSRVEWLSQQETERNTKSLRKPSYEQFTKLLRKIANPTPESYKTRRRGSYVVVKALTGHWPVSSDACEASAPLSAESIEGA